MAETKFPRPEPPKRLGVALGLGFFSVHGWIEMLGIVDKLILLISK